MAIFNRYFTVLFRLKTKWISLLLIIQTVASFAMTFFNYNNGHVYINRQIFSNFFTLWLAIFIVQAWLFTGIFYLTTCFQNERVSGNQTWRLIPIDDKKFYFDNILSSFAALLFFVILEIICTLILSVVTFTFDSQFHSSLIELFADIGRHLQQVDLEIMFNFFGALMMIILCAFFGYFIISFLNYSSRALLDYLPQALSKAYFRIIAVLVIILVAWLAIKASNIGLQIISFPFRFMLGETTGTNDDLAIALLLMLLINILFWFFDTILFSKFFEAREGK